MRIPRRIVVGWSMVAAFTVPMGFGPPSARAERYALAEAPRTDPADFRVQLRHGVELRYDGSAQLSLSIEGRSLAQFELSIAPPKAQPPDEAPPGGLRSELYHWRYYHVDGVAFWIAASDLAGDPALLGVEDRVWSWRRRMVRPHVSVGKANSKLLRVATRRVHDVDGSDLYVGVLRLDGHEGAMRGSELRWAQASGWPLALFVARTQKELWFLAGQAQWTYDEATREGSAGWAAPPMCARCRSPRIGRADLQITRDEDRLRIAVEFSATPEVELVAAESLVLAGRPLGGELLVEGNAGATYELSLEDPAARSLVRRALDGDVELSVEMATGLSVEPERVEVDVDPALEAWAGRGSTASDGSASDEEPVKHSEFPDHLSPRLLQSWPNPFQDRTTIEVTVPATIGEAFDLNDELRKRVDPRGPVPFGGDPMVRIRVYNVGGQLIRLLSEETRAPGRYSVGWDGNDLSGRPVAAGAYYVNVEIGEYNVTQRVLRLRG